jgi:hypothetical protein
MDYGSAMTGPQYPGYGQQPGQGQPDYGPPLGSQPRHGQPPAEPPVYSQQPAQPAYGQPPASGQPPTFGQQSAYEQPQAYPAQAPAYGNQNPRAFGVVGFVFAVVGAIAGVVAFTALDWFKSDTGVSGHSHFSDIHHVLSAFGGDLVQPIAKDYFAWAGWVLLAAAFVFAVLAVLPNVASGPFRAFGALVALVGIAGTFAAINISKHGLAYTTELKDARLGFWFAVGAFVLIFLGALIGPSHRRT